MIGKLLRKPASAQAELLNSTVVPHQCLPCQQVVLEDDICKTLQDVLFFLFCELFSEHEREHQCVENEDVRIG
jgi:hypothetical protein